MKEKRFNKEINRANGLLFDMLNIKDMSLEILDVGCGLGGMCIALNKKGFNNVIGIDVVVPPKEKEFKFLRIDLNNSRLPFEDKNFDVIIAIGVMEEVLYMNNVLSELNRVLKDDGIILLSGYNLYYFINRIKMLFGIGFGNRFIISSYVNHYTVPPIYYKKKYNEFFDVIETRGNHNLNFVNFLPNLFACQFLFKCKKKERLLPEES